MRYIFHSSTPPASIVAAFREQPHPTNPGQAWKDFARLELREHLWELQYGLCAYCERFLDPAPEKSTMEHIVPKTRNPEMTFQYHNLVLCCDNKDTCNLHKKDLHFEGYDLTGRWTQGFIAPTQPRCEKSFRYLRDGSIKPSDQADEPDATETLRILNLNHPALQTDRREYFQAIEKMIDDMEGQDDAIKYYLDTELTLGSDKPFYTGKLQNFSF